MAQVKEGSSFGKHVGHFTINPLCVNPNNQLKKDVLGFNIDESKEFKDYVGVTETTGSRYARITFFYTIKDLNNPKIKESFSVLLSDQQSSFGEQYLQFIDANGNISAGIDPSEAESKSREFASMYNKKEASVFKAKGCRPLYRGEETLMKIYKGLTGGTIIFDQEDIDTILAGGDESSALLNSYFVVKTKSGAYKGLEVLLGMDKKGNVVLYEDAIGKLDFVKTRLNKRPFEGYDKEAGARVPIYYPQDFKLASITLEDMADNVDDYSSEEETHDDIDTDQF